MIAAYVDISYAFCGNMTSIVKIRILRAKTMAAMTLLTFASLGHFEVCASTNVAVITVSGQPLSNGRIDPKLFGNFVELLEDVVPGMWAEMLIGRSFEGVTPAADWCYYDGRPTICDRVWETNSTWRYDVTNAFNGDRCAELLPQRSRIATLRQTGLTVKRGMSYNFRDISGQTTRSSKLRLICAHHFRTEIGSRWRPLSFRNYQIRGKLGCVHWIRSANPNVLFLKFALKGKGMYGWTKFR